MNSAATMPIPAGLAPAAGTPREFLSLLHCPYCGSAFRIEGPDANADVVEYAVLRCSCHDYPVVYGIPVLQQLDGLDRVVNLVRSREPAAALLRTLDLFRVQWALRSKLHRLRYHWNCRRLIANPGATFRAAAYLARMPRVFADYLIHRYANPSFLAAIGPLLLLRHASQTAPSGERVLDLACGAGHASFLLSLLCPGIQAVSADQDFVNVYLARRFLNPRGMHLCIDAQVPSPLPSQSFGAVFCQDAFHYMSSKKAVVAELKRIARPDALWVFPHLHNRLVPNLVAGVPLAPEAYLECFDLPGARLFEESALLRGLAREGAVDFTCSAPLASLNKAGALTFIGGPSDVWRVCRDFPSAFCERPSSLALNPIYRRRDGGSLEFEWPNPVMAAECAGTEDFLPRTCRLSESWPAQLADEGPAPPWLAEMVAKFVLVPLPRRYGAEPEPPRSR